MAATGSVLSRSASCTGVATYGGYLAMLSTDRAHSVYATDHPAIYTSSWTHCLCLLLACGIQGRILLTLTLKAMLQIPGGLHALTALMVMLLLKRSIPI